MTILFTGALKAEATGSAHFHLSLFCLIIPSITMHILYPKLAVTLKFWSPFIVKLSSVLACLLPTQKPKERKYRPPIS